MLVERRNVQAPLINVMRLVPKLESYAIIPTNTVLHRFRSGAKLYYLGEDTWCVKGTTAEVNAGVKEFVFRVRGGGKRKEDMVTL